ncbi:MAG: SRPBCC domain-containing protein [Acidobacteriota bacterium]|nr:SRPBCC domain-containing protein [Acidobacteriota bacterium]
MSNAKRTIECTIERTIPAPLDEVFDAWLNPKIPGNPWNAAEKLLLNPKVDGFFYWTIKGTAHYGRFTEVARPGRLQHTWVSPSTLGEESVVTVTFKKHEQGTVMTLVHSNLPDSEGGRSHEKGWNFFFGIFTEQFAKR